MSIQQKQQEVDEARNLAKNGYPIEQIASMMHHTYKTIQNYLDPSYSLVNGHYNARISGKLAPYEKDVLELRNNGMTYPKIHSILCVKGYTGSIASLRMFLQKERIRMQEQEEQNKAHSEYIHRKSLCQLIYGKIEKVATISLAQYKQATETSPELGELYTLVKDFHAVIFSKSLEKLSPWMEYARKLDIPKLQTFLEGISKDIDAVKNGIAYTFNNDLTEGNVNKIKVIKRSMYGCNSFELLRA